MNLRLLLLTLCQGMLLINNVVFIAVNGLVGLALAPTAWLATLPITAYVAGGALATGLVARTQRRYGRQRSFQVGLVVAMFSAAVCAWAALNRQFWLLTAATLVAGFYNANGSLYRFAAVELVKPEFKERAISWVLAGGIIGGVVGPNLANWSRTALDVPFAGAYLALIGVALLSLVMMSFISFPPLPGQGTTTQQGRPTAEIIRQPVFIIAAAGSAIGYGVMNLLMGATPIAMAQCSHPFSAAALVLEWHVLGMFLPSFFTGKLIKRFGVLPIMTTGLVLNIVCVAFALTGSDVMHFLGALLVLGVGWNFLYIGASALATDAWRPEERTRGQAALDFTVYSTMTLTSFSSGALVTTGGWTAMNLGTLAPLVLLGAALLWLRRLRQVPVPVPA
ncbi:MAG: MFS transporter [Microbacteriaceae bacterium]|nr:MFS transporter [Burkholderiaceae bacterium]